MALTRNKLRPLTRGQAVTRAIASSKFQKWVYYAFKRSRIVGTNEKWSGERLEVEQHYSPSELASTWGLSVETIRRLFQDEPGVLKMGNATGSASGKRKYKTLRIPYSVAIRLHRRLSD